MRLRRDHSAAADKRILIVDDDRGICELVCIRLGVQGMLTVVAHDGLSGLARVREFRPHAMVLDINMPLMDGFSVMARLGRARMAALRTLVLTARGRGDDVRRAVTLGARDYLAKPCHDKQLLARLARTLRT